MFFTSKFSLSLILAVIVPCFSPSSFKVRMPAEENRDFISSGVAVVAKSRSWNRDRIATSNVIMHCA